MKILVMLIVNIATDFAGIFLTGNIYGVAIATVFPVLVAIWIGYVSLRKYEYFTLAQIPAVGFAELKLFLREKLNFRRSLIP